MGSISVGDSRSRHQLNIPSFLISSPSLKFTLFLYLINTGVIGLAYKCSTMAFTKNVKLIEQSALYVCLPFYEKSGCKKAQPIFKEGLDTTGAENIGAF